MEEKEVPDKSEEKSKIGKHLLIFSIALLFGFTVDYFLGTENSQLYGFVAAWVVLEIWVFIDAALKS